MAWGSQLDERSGQRTPGGSYGRGDPNTTGGSPDKFFARGNETLYEAYNQLHTLAQEFDKPFDAPAILVVGQQTDGKSGACNLRVCVSPTAELKWKQSTPIDRQQCTPAAGAVAAVHAPAASTRASPQQYCAVCLTRQRRG